MVEGLTSHHCSQVAAAKDHTVVLTEGGYVYTFGLNTFHQLGLAPPPASAHVPKQVEFETNVCICQLGCVFFKLEFRAINLMSVYLGVF